ncbi:hypothetical protein EDC01DRAFT_630482 [Geopyxis carbonaria]|nr:hypothetical protein EDC01DRAFT_630482 [Geopyxis carbonaria]
MKRQKHRLLLLPVLRSVVLHRRVRPTRVLRIHSVDSATTYSTAGGSCTSVEDEEDVEYSLPGKEIGLVTPANAQSLAVSEQKGKQRERSGRARKTQWTEEMDAHLWRTYALYQQDPKITPFFVLPGQVPPLGVCYKVAREAKRSWKDAKLSGDWNSPLLTPKPKAKRSVPPAAETSNRGDALRKISPYTFPASESSTRRRLRDLCRANYGPSSNPHNFRQQRRRNGFGGDLKSRSTTLSPSPIKSSTLKRPNTRDPFGSTRSMALSLTTSTASSMMPSGVLASLASGQDVSGAGAHFGGSLAETLHSNPIPVIPAPMATPEAQKPKLSLQDSALGDMSMPIKTVERQDIHTHRRAMSSSLDSQRIPTLLPPLELKSSKSPYGTWPRRLKRPELGDEEGESSTPLPPQRRVRRGLSDLFGGEPSQTPVPATAPNKSRSRMRGYTISAGTNPFASRRRPRPSAPLLTVTGPISYEGSADMGSPLAKRDTPNRYGHVDLNLDHMPKRLGSPFMERLMGKGKAPKLDDDQE